MDHAGGSSSGGGGGAPESNWPQSLDKPLTQELFNFGVLVPPGCRLAKPWRISKDGYPTLTNPATSEQLRVHPGGRYNTHGRHAFSRTARTTTTSSGVVGSAAMARRQRAVGDPPPPPAARLSTYMDLNKDNTHWVTVVMHKEKEEFQRREIGVDIAEANATGSVQYPDVSRWPIKTYDMPQQEDG
ncbi:hypothetical protein ZWY2020_042950 [Hordeum vulgare]|nr:hypothetical protein ZWY2020_042950 [Hordeum vulgare]